jgi:hypothetical protein
MANYKQLFEQELLKLQNPDPAQKQLEDQIMAPSQGASLAPTMGLIDHLTGSNLTAVTPKEESLKDKLGQLLQARNQAQSGKLGALGKLAQLEMASNEKALDRDFKERMFGLQMAKYRDKANAAPKLGSEDKKALGYTQSLKRDLELYKEAIKSGGLRPGLWTDIAGDTPTTAIRKRLVENYGRLQSGGAISGDEEKRFGALFGNMMDSPDVIAQKLVDIENEINSKNSLYGGGYNPASGRVPSASGGMNPMDYDSMDDAELEARYMAKMGGR